MSYRKRLPGLYDPSQRPVDLAALPSWLKDQAESITAPTPDRNNAGAKDLQRRIAARPQRVGEGWLVRRGHAFTYLGIFLFTFVLYFRPYEMFPGLEGLSSLALILGVATIAVFVPTQFALEGKLSVMPTELKLLLLLVLAALASVPLGMDPSRSWTVFTDTFIKAALMFVVIVNVVRTEARMKGLIWLALAVSVVLSINALDDYRLGRLGVDGYRVNGLGKGLFGNTNDMALHLVTMMPMAVVLLLGSSRGLVKKLTYFALAVLLVAGVVVTFSRGAFLGLVVSSVVLIWKLGRRQRVRVLLAGGIAGLLFLVAAPSNYGLRMLSIFIPALDPVGSSEARQGHLWQSIYVTLRHPIAGLGMGNFNLVSAHSQVTHNAYTQVSSELGIAALVLYLAFMIVPLRRLGQVEQESFAQPQLRQVYYLSVGLQASLLAYMVSSFFASVAYQWYIYYLVGYAICLRRIHCAALAELQPAAAAAGVKQSLSQDKRITV